MFWVHMLATVAWVGSLVAMALLILPAMQRTLPPAAQLAFLAEVQKRLEPVAWFSLGLLVFTGLFQLSVNPHYDGFLAISNRWSAAILVKHGLVILLTISSALQTWEVLPAIRRVLLQAEKADPARLRSLQRQETLLLRLNLLLAMLILAATALARAA